ncbi:WGxxGxxG family protein [Bacillus sp. FJAT-27245]|uniref:WGxxGxxG family protein n=1 Tax=Bacillus sp. FJAT-27245 TaxID=1684144 RepID=UPI0006A799F2|nr:WGxxGxxG family protein [Bacillus sp. FJAT-27245]
MFKKLLYSVCALLVTLMMFGNYTGFAQNPITNLFESTESAQDMNNNDDNDNDNDWGWIGLIGLAGLLGMRRNDKRQ